MISLTKWAEHFIILPDGNPIKFEPYQKQILDHCFSFDGNGKLPYQVIIYSCPKKSGKTTVNAIVMAYWSYNIEIPNELIVSANKKEQAVARAFRELKGFIQRNPVLSTEAASITGNRINLNNGTIVTAIPVDYSGEAGANQGLVSHDELWGLVTELQRRLYDELTPVPTRINSIRFITTYAGFEGESALLEDLYHQIFDEQHNVKKEVSQPLGQDFPAYAKGDLFVYWDHKPRMPWQTPEYYVSQKQQLRLNTYLRLHENRWVSSESSMFDMEKWDSCIDEDHSPPLPDKSIHLWVGVDASTKKDRSAVLSVFRDGSKVKLGPKRFWQPTAADPMDLEETMESYLLELNKGYTLISVKYDPFQFHRSAMTLAKKGLPMVEYPQTTTNLTEIGQNIYDLVQYRNIILYPCKDLRFEATCAIGKETTRGVRIVKEKLSHKVDQIVSLAMAALDAAKERDGLMPEFNRQRHTYKCERKATLP
jgi:phage terminase large subunit-like protein